MVEAKTQSAKCEAVQLLRQALGICDQDGIGLAAAPYIDLAINLLLAERPSLDAQPAPCR